MNWNDAAEDFLNQVLAQTPRPVREQTDAQLRATAESMAEGKWRVRLGAAIFSVILARGCRAKNPALFS